MKTPRIACVIGSAIVASTLHADTFSDDFEAFTAGPVPAGRWIDVDDRAGTPNFVLPTANIVETTDAFGSPTNALQTDENVGTSGVFTQIEESRFNSLVVDVRIDHFAVGGGWPIGVGYSGDVGFDDINQNPHAVVYAWPDRRWRLFISTGIDATPGVDLLINTPQFVLGDWYRIQVDIDALTGAFEATVSNVETGAVLGSRSHQHLNWDPDRMYNAVTFFDGESNTATNGGQATMDNVSYTSEINLACPTDFTGDGQLDFFDISAFLSAFSEGNLRADFTGDGSLDFFDISFYLFLFTEGCP